jgi:hypothetical protein
MTATVEDRSDAIYGIVAEFSSPETLLKAARAAYASGYRQVDAYSPMPIEGLAEALGFRRTGIPLIVLIGGLLGGIGGYLMQYYCIVISYPLNIGGRPLHSWPAFIPVTFEMTILGASLAAVFGMLVLNELPMPYHPLFNVHEFGLASRDRFFLSVESGDALFDLQKTQEFLTNLQARGVWVVDP